MSKYNDVVARITLNYQNYVAEYHTHETMLVSAKDKLKELQHKYDIIERSRVAIEQVKPLLSAASITQLEKLANTALLTIFGIDATVQYDVESKRFVVNYPDKTVDLVDSSGGGIVTVLS